MAPLQGHTLGERQKYYNQLVKEAYKTKPPDLLKINFDDDDVDNMIKIDIACKDRNVNYVLEVLKCEDMLYVSRAINKSTWLITDPQYAHIINPEYLHGELFPQMNIKATSKLMLHIKRNLKDETRVQEFYHYVNNRNPKTAIRWLQNCSVDFIRKIVIERPLDFSDKLLRRLYRKSFTIFLAYLEGYAKIHPYQSYDHIVNNAVHLVKSYTDEFLGHINSQYHLASVHFKEKHTIFLMKKHTQKIMDNISKYYDHIDLKVFVKFLKRDEIKRFLLTHDQILRHCDSFTVMSPFLEKMPRENVHRLLKALINIKYGHRINIDDYDEPNDGSEHSNADCSNKPDEDDSDSESNNSDNSSEKSIDSRSDLEKLFSGLEYNRLSHSNIGLYRWYQYAPFNMAFDDIKKFIFAESTPEERHSMLVVLLKCAKYDFNHVKTVLQYYHDKHINEPYMHKITFVNSLLSQHNTFRFDDATWNTLNAVFHSLEVYIESDNDVQNCIASVIVYNVLRDQQVPKVVEDKFQFNTLFHIKKHLSQQEQDTIFNYLYNLLVTRLHDQNIDSEIGMHNAIEILKNMWSLIKAWQKDETHRHLIINKIAELGNINKASPWYQAIKQRRKRRRKKLKGNMMRYRRRRYRFVEKKPPEPYINFPYLSKMVKPHRKDLFENSLILHPCEDACLNALKHDPGLLSRWKTETDELRSNDDVSLKRFLRKLRIYWPETLAPEWSNKNIEILQEFTGHRALIRGLMVLLPPNKLVAYIKSYTPKDNKIEWSEVNEIELSIQKHIAKTMHLARPQLSAEVVLWYAKGDYLQHALLSLNTMYYNLKTSELRKYIFILLKAPVSLRKHGIRLAFAKFKLEELVKQLPIMWKSSKNSSIRAILFKTTFKLLCNETKAMWIKELWAVCSSFLDNINQEENKVIYETLGKINKVPLSVIGECYQKTYLFLKSLPPKADLDNNLDKVIGYAAGFIEYLNCEFVENVLLGSIYDLISNQNSVYMNILSSYLLCSKDTNIQIQKYKNLLHPVIEPCVLKWANEEEQNIKNGLDALLGYICQGISHFVFNKNMVMPTDMLRKIENALIKGHENKNEDYKLLAVWKLSVNFVELLEDMMKNPEKTYNFKSIRSESIEKLGKLCVEQFIEDTKRLFPSIYLIFDGVIERFCRNFRIEEDDHYYQRHMFMSQLTNAMLKSCGDPSVFMLALRLLPKCSNNYDIDKQICLYPSKEISMHYFHHYDTQYTGTYKSPSSESDTNSSEESDKTKPDNGSVNSGSAETSQDGESSDDDSDDSDSSSNDYGIFD